MRLAALLLLPLTMLSLSAHAVVDINATRYPLMLCTNGQLVAQLYSLENQKDAQLIVRDVTRSGPNIIYSDRVRPMEGENAQVFLAETASLHVVANGEMLKGFLNLHRDRPSVAQVLNCQTYFRIQSLSK